MESELKGIKRLKSSAPVAPLKLDYSESDRGATILFCNEYIEELSTPMPQEEFMAKEKELEAKYPGILS